jgi:hypothetical protein
MTTADTAADTYEADEGRFLYYYYSTKGRNTNVADPAFKKVWNVGLENYNREIQDPRVHPFVTNEAADKAIAAPYHGRKVPGIGVRMGGYSVATTDGSAATSPKLLATDYLVDCTALVLVGQDPANPAHKTTVLAHIDVVTDVKREIPQLMRQMPAGYVVTATLLSGGDDVSINMYTQIDILRALKAEKQVKDIYHGKETTSVLVDVASGHIFTSNRPALNVGSSKKHYSIDPHLFPITTHIAFYKHELGGYSAKRDIEWLILENRTAPDAPFARNAALFPVVVKDHKLLMTEPTVESELKALGSVAPDKLDGLSKKLAREIGLPVTLKHDAAHSIVNIEVNGAVACIVPVPKATAFRRN